MPKNNKKGIPKKDGKGVSVNQGRGGCKKPQKNRKGYNKNKN